MGISARDVFARTMRALHEDKNLTIHREVGEMSWAFDPANEQFWHPIELFLAEKGTVGTRWDFSKDFNEQWDEWAEECMAEKSLDHNLISLLCDAYEACLTGARISAYHDPSLCTIFGDKHVDLQDFEDFTEGVLRFLDNLDLIRAMSVWFAQSSSVREQPIKELSEKFTTTVEIKTHEVSRLCFMLHKLRNQGAL